MGKKCVQCGVSLENGASFCNQCGAKQPEQTLVENKPNGAQDALSANTGSNVLRKNSGKGMASFICGIVSICSCGCLILPEILGIVLGIMAIADKKTKHNMAVAGLIMSIVSIIIILELILIKNSPDSVLDLLEAVRRFSLE